MNKVKLVLRFIKRYVFTPKNIRGCQLNRYDYSLLPSRNIDFKESDYKTGNKKVLYTCITGGYDNLIVQSHYNNNWDYVCYTDTKELLEQKQVGMWEIRPLVYKDSSNPLNNRWHKAHPHLLFPEYDESIYIDGNIDMLDNLIFDEIESKKEDNNILIPKHPVRKCIYKEIKTVIHKKKASAEDCFKMKDILIENGFPKKYGLCENNVIYRKHNDKNVIKIMEEWWGYILNVVPRDQLSLCFILWKNNYNLSNIYLSNTRLERKHFHLYYKAGHK